MKSDKAGGPDGIPPGLFKLLPATWIMFLVTLFNKIFVSAVYPMA